MPPIDQEMVQYVVAIILGSATLIQVYYFLLEMSGPGFGKEKIAGAGVKQPVSVIICARNEMKNLKSFLPAVLDQDYPQYQVIVVNDCSWDESAKYLEEMEDAYPHLKIVTIQEQEKYQHGKKFALTLGIKAAAHEHLLLTDADCIPASRQWIHEMMQGFTPGKEIVVSYGAYRKEAGLLNKWIRFDTVMNALLYLTRAMKGSAYMGVGRNLAYTKSLFFANKGFANHYHIMSGDDDLFVNETANHQNTAVVLNAAAFTISKPKTSLYTWIWQKKRHMSTGTFYKNSDRALIGIYYLSLFLFWMAILLAFLVKLNWQLIVGIVAFRLITQMIVCWKGYKKLGETDLFLFLPLFDLIAAFSYPLLAISNLFIKTKSWK
ncbi:MAG: glycosyltransferase [Bacteroidia bacterium]|nr:glycosyltransferase [Bacteroidia bacterium]